MHLERPLPLQVLKGLGAKHLKGPKDPKALTLRPQDANPTHQFRLAGWYQLHLERSTQSLAGAGKPQRTLGTIEWLLSAVRPRKSPSRHSFRQVTDEARRPLPLSQLLSLPEPDEPSDSQDATIDASDVVDPVESHTVSHHSDGSDGGSEELQVKLKNTFLHWEPVRSPDHVMSLRRSRSLPISLPEEGRSSIDVRN